MTDAKSDSEELAESLHRTILGGLLSILLLVGIGLSFGLTQGDYLSGILGVGLALMAGYWILDLFNEAAS